MTLVLLAGDAHEDYADSTSPLEMAIFQNAFSFVAVASGPVEELWLRTNDETNTCTSVLLGIFPDNGTGLAPTDTLLASVEVVGTPPTDSWIGGTVTGSAAVVEGQTYWLASRGRGGTLHFNCLADGGLGRARVNTDDPDFITWGTSFSELSSLAPIGFKALGPAAPDPTSGGETHVEIALTTLHRPEKTTDPPADADPARVLGWAQDYTELLVTIPRNDARTAEITFSIDDPIVQHLYRDAHEAVTDHEIQISTDHEVMLFVRYRGTPVIWAPIIAADWKGSDRAVTVHAVDVQMLIDHQIHRDDDAFPETEADRWVPGTSDGIRTLLAAATPDDAQTADGTPSHGINAPPAGVGTTEGATMQIAVELDDGVYEKITEVAGYEKSVDVAVIPRDVEDPDAFPYYADMVCYVEEGQDAPRVVFESGFGRDNAESMDWSPGAAYMTHAIVRDAENKARVPRANTDSRRRTGIYSHTENLPSASPPGTMTARAEALIRQYSLPVDAHSIVIRDAPSELADIAGAVFHFPDDINLGYIVTCEVQDGYYRKRVHGQINEVRIRQADAAVFKEEIDVVPEIVAVAEVSEEDP